MNTLKYNNKVHKILYISTNEIFIYLINLKSESRSQVTY